MAELFRSWIGAPLPVPLLEKIKEAQFQIKRRAGGDAIRWIPQGELALLLVSVGEVGPPTLLRVGTLVEQVAARHSAIRLTLSGAGGSPNMTMPKSAWLGIAGDTEALKKLRQDLALCVRPLVTAIDEKPYEPVIEIGLLRKFDESARTEMGRSLKHANVGELGRFTLDALHVLSSRSTSAGPALYSLKAFPLG